MANTNPVILYGNGVQPNIFFSGAAKAVLKDENDVIIRTQDPVGETSTELQFQAWVSTFNYDLDAIVWGSDGKLYISLVNANVANDPISSPTDWQLFVNNILADQTLVAVGEVAVGNATTGLDGVAITPGYVGIGNATTGLAGVNINTKGSILVGNGTLPIALAVGTNGQVLTADSAQTSGLKYATPASVNGWQYLSTVTTAGAATVDVETGFSSTYDNYIILAFGLTTAGVENILTRWKLGGSYVTSNTYIDVSGTTTATSLVSLSNAGVSATTNGALRYEIFGVNTATTKFGRVASQGVQGTPNLSPLNTAHFNTGTGALTGIRFYGSGGGNIAGTFALYGVVKS